MNLGKELERKIYLFFLVVVIISLVGGYLGLSEGLINQLMEWTTSVFVGVVLSVIAGYIVELFTGDTLKKISFTIKILGIKFSITAFFIATIIAKILLFGI